MQVRWELLFLAHEASTTVHGSSAVTIGKEKRKNVLKLTGG